MPCCYRLLSVLLAGLALATSSTAFEYRGGLVTPPLSKPSFTLIDTAGAAFDFRARTDGYVTLLFFGYTHCPDMCPMQMATIAQALKALPAEEANQFRVVFVAPDPERDTPSTLRAWLDHFDRRFIGLSGSKEAIRSAQIAANLDPAKKSKGASAGSYGISHAAWVFAYTKDNLAHVIYPVGVKKEDWIHDLPLLVQEKWTKGRPKPVAGNPLR